MGFITSERKNFIQLKKARDPETNKEIGGLQFAFGNELYPGIEGKLLEISERTPVFTTGPARKLVLDIEFDEKVYEVSFGFDSNFGRNLINSLLTVEETGGIITMRFYRSKNEFDNLYLEYNHKKMEWMYPPSEFPKPEITYTQSGKVAKDNKGNDIKDMTNVKEFWDTAFKTLLVKFGNNNSSNVNHATGEVEEEPIDEQFAEPTNEKQPF